MTTTYDRRRARRERERERDLCGETMAEYRARENPARTKPGADIPHVRCERTPSLFASRDAAEQDREKWTDRQGALF